jgi:putative SbcD/Mre11-related phosphoesterase
VPPDPWEPLSDGRVLGYTPREPLDIQSVRPRKGVELTSLHAALLDDSVLVVSDLHLGLEAVLHMQGVSVPKWQRGVMVPRLDALLRHYNPARVVVNGDFKHNFSRNLMQEWREAAQVLRMLRERAAVALVKGNHDNYIDSMAQSAGVPVLPRVELEGFTLAHGHEPVDSERCVVVGHEHPAIMLRDEVGARVRMPCFLLGEDVLALPAFSPLSGGTDVTVSVTGRGEHFTPVFEGADADALRVFAVGEGEVLDFRTLGELRSIKGL